MARSPPARPAPAGPPPGRVLKAAAAAVDHPGVALLRWWLRPALGRARTRLTGSRFWGTALLVAAFVPFSAALLGHRPWIVTGAASLTLAMCGLAALTTGSGRAAGNVLLAVALFAGLLLVFWMPGDVLQTVIAIVLLTVAGFGVRAAAAPLDARPAPDPAA